MGSGPPYLDVLNQLLGGCVDGGLGVRHILNGAGPPGGLVEQLRVEAIAVLASVHGDIPIACNRHITHMSALTSATKATLLHHSPRSPAYVTAS